MPLFRSAVHTTIRSLASWGLLLVLAGASATAQPLASCEASLVWAQEFYVEQQFTEAEAAARDCLGRPGVASADALEAHRLLALIYLRQDDLDKAKHAVIGVLSVDFEYVPDPIFDPPAYADLVEIVRRQLHVNTDQLVTRDQCAAACAAVSAASETTETAETAAPAMPPLRSLRSIHLGLALGAGSYSGERGINSPTLLSEFDDNGGFSLAFDGTYYARPGLAAAASYRVVRIPLLFSNDVRAEDVYVRPDDSSEWLHIVTALARALYEPDAQVAPYVQAGAGFILSYLNNKPRLAVGPQVGVGFDVAATPQLAGFAELNVLIAMPGDAVDRVNANGALGDILTFAGVGVRYRVGSR